jgi:hypothetical protein
MSSLPGLSGSVAAVCKHLMCVYAFLNIFIDARLDACIDTCHFLVVHMIAIIFIKSVSLSRAISIIPYLVLQT